jgi:divalent metal cation (Fe/Co/Zn/Cd) transporter
VDALIELLTMHLGPDHLLVAARVDFSGDINADEAEDLATKIDRRLAEQLSVTPHVFIDPTRKGGQEDARPAPETSRPG